MGGERNHLLPRKLLSEGFENCLKNVAGKAGINLYEFLVISRWYAYWAYTIQQTWLGIQIFKLLQYFAVCFYERIWCQLCNSDKFAFCLDVHTAHGKHSLAGLSIYRMDKEIPRPCCSGLHTACTEKGKGKTGFYLGQHLNAEVFSTPHTKWLWGSARGKISFCLPLAQYEQANRKKNT